MEWRFIYDCVLFMIAQIFLYVNFCLGDVRIGEYGNQFINLLNGAVPPLQTLEQVDHFIVESAAYDSCRIADGYRKGGMSDATVAFVPIMAPSPICTPGIIVTFCPIHTSLPMTVSPLSGNSSITGVIAPPQSPPIM